MTQAPLPLVHLRHARMIRRPGGRPLCRGGIEAWCTRYGIDWNDFTGSGVAGELIVATGDAYAQKLIENAQKEQDDGQQ